MKRKDWISHLNQAYQNHNGMWISDKDCKEIRDLISKGKKSGSE